MLPEALQRTLETLRRDVERLKTRETLYLDDSTWTPAYTGTLTAGTFTYVAQRGVYTRVGRLVYVYGRVVISAITGAPTGNITITGLPFVAEATHQHPVTFGYINQFNYAAGAMQLTGVVGAGDDVIALYESFDNGGAVAVPAANFTNAACDLIFSGVYRAG